MTFESNAQRATHASFSSAKTASARGPLIAALAALSTFCAPVAAGAQESATTGAESEESEEIVVRPRAPIAASRTSPFASRSFAARRSKKKSS
jgi:hypothetical protein